MALASHKRIRFDPSSSPSTSGSNSETDEAHVRAGAECTKLPRAEDDPMEAIADQESVKLYDRDAEEDHDDEHCVICLQEIQDRTILPCAHDRLCFNCILLWCEQSRKCPLCNAHIGDYLIHNFRSKYDYSKHYLPPLASSPPPTDVLARFSGIRATRGRDRGDRWGRRRRRSTSQDREDALELAISRRRWVYHHDLYAKHVASNPYTRYKACPTPSQIAASSDLVSRATIFVRRELRVWINLDVEFLTTFIISVMKSLDLRSEPAIKLLAEFLDMDTPYFVGNPDEPSCPRFRNAEHFAHELYSYLRSPFRDLSAYDAAVQYDVPGDISPLPARHPLERSRWDTSRRRQTSRNVQRTFSPSRSCSRERDSPSPVRSHDFDDFFRPHRSHLPSNAQSDHQLRSYNRSSKGKQKGAPSRHDTWRPRDRVDQTVHDDTVSEHAGPSSRHRRNDPSPSAKRSPPHYPHYSPASDDDDEQSSVHDFERSAASRNYRSEAPQTAPPATPNSSVNKSREDPQGIHIIERSRESAKLSELPSLTSDQTSDALKPVWGIRIKGQAKLLDRNDRPDVSESCRTADVTKDERVKNINISSSPQKRSRNPTDLLHAHLGTIPLGRSLKTAAVASSEINQSSTKKVSQDAIYGDGVSSDQPNQTDGVPPQRHVVPSLLGSSASEIMAKTRVKLAKLRATSSQKPLIDVVPSASSSSADLNLLGNNSSSAPDMRTRLVQRLEQERRLASQSDEAKDEFKGVNHSAKDFVGSAGNSLSSDVEQVEKRLRAQALLQVRSVAEKKKVSAELPAGDKAAVTREDALKARLLSRRA